MHSSSSSTTTTTNTTATLLNPFGFGQKHAYFYVRLTIHELKNVPLSSGEFHVKWRFKHTHPIADVPGISIKPPYQPSSSGQPRSAEQDGTGSADPGAGSDSAKQHGPGSDDEGSSSFLNSKVSKKRPTSSRFGRKSANPTSAASSAPAPASQSQAASASASATEPCPLRHRVYQ